MLYIYIHIYITENYKHLHNNPTATNNEWVHSLIRRFENENLFHKNLAEGIKTNSPWTTRFCTQPKIHKERNPGRPVISSVGCHTSKISEYVDYDLQPIVQ